MDIYNYISKFKDKKPILNNILKDVVNGKLKIRNFDEIDNRTLAQMRMYMVSHKIIKTNALTNISDKIVVNKAKKIWYGWCYNNIIYNNNEISKTSDLQEEITKDSDGE